MNQRKKSTSSTAAAAAAAATPPERTSVKPRQPSPQAHRIQNYILVWLDASIDKVNDQDCISTISSLRETVNNVNTFTAMDDCINFISNIQKEKTFLICSGSFGQKVVPVVHAMTQVCAIYIFCGNKDLHEQWIEEWSKVKGVFTDFKPVCEALEQAVLECDQNSIAMSFITSNTGTAIEFDQLDRSFMYTQVLKEILPTIDVEQQRFKEFISYCRIQFANNNKQLKNVDKLKQEYRKHPPIWWYNYRCFLYSMLNRALGTMEINLIVNMGFFIRDLEKHITTLHSEQHAARGPADSLVVYRGQGLTRIDFDKLMKKKGGLLSFNNFLFTSSDREVSLNFARDTMKNSDVGLLFVIRIDPSIPSTPFANVRDVGGHQDGKDILFSLHSVFRIGQAKKIDENNRLWQVELLPISDNDSQLQVLTEHIRKETFPHMKEWYRLGELLIKLGQFNEAQQVYEILLKQTSTDSKIAFINHRLGSVRDNQGKYEAALTFYKKAIEIYETRVSNDRALANSYGSIGLVYEKLKQYPKALSYHEKDLELSKKNLSQNHLDLATPNANIGWVHRSMGDYSKALSYYQHSLDIRKRSLPPNHPDLQDARKDIEVVKAFLSF